MPCKKNKVHTMNAGKWASTEKQWVLAQTDKIEKDKRTKGLGVSI